MCANLTHVALSTCTIMSMCRVALCDLNMPCRSYRSYSARQQKAHRSVHYTTAVGPHLKHCQMGCCVVPVVICYESSVKLQLFLVQYKFGLFVFSGYTPLFSSSLKNLSTSFCYTSEQLSHILGFCFMLFSPIFPGTFTEKNGLAFPAECKTNFRKTCGAQWKVVNTATVLIPMLANKWRQQTMHALLPLMLLIQLVACAA